MENKKGQGLNVNVIILIVVILITIVFVCLEIMNYKQYDLSHYSCEEIDLSIASGKCLPQFKITLIRRCFESVDKYVYYKLNCWGQN